MLTACADALGEMYEFLTVYVTEPAYDLGGKIGLIRIETWTPQCVENNDEIYKALLSYWEEGDEEAASELLADTYSDWAWDDARKLAESKGGELLTVHWVCTGMISVQRSAALILLDKIKVC